MRVDILYTCHTPLAHPHTRRRTNSGNAAAVTTASHVGAAGGAGGGDYISSTIDRLEELIRCVDVYVGGSRRIACLHVYMLRNKTFHREEDIEGLVKGAGAASSKRKKKKKKKKQKRSGSSSKKCSKKERKRKSKKESSRVRILFLSENRGTRGRSI